MSANSELVGVCRNNGFDIEYVRNFDGTDDHSTMVVSFPCKFPKDTMFAGDMSAVDPLAGIRRLQAEWSDNSVSVTVYYKKEELDSIKAWLDTNYNNVKSVSFLLHNDHGFDQAPLEEIDKKTYNAMKKRSTPITSLKDIKMEDIEIAECAGGACPVR